MSNKVYVCKECGQTHYPALPINCIGCGRELRIVGRDIGITKLEIFEI